MNEMNLIDRDPPNEKKLKDMTRDEVLKIYLEHIVFADEDGRPYQIKETHDGWYAHYLN